jgi:hypothetical protein
MSGAKPVRDRSAAGFFNIKAFNDGAFNLFFMDKTQTSATVLGGVEADETYYVSTRPGRVPRRARTLARRPARFYGVKTGVDYEDRLVR